MNGIDSDLVTASWIALAVIALALIVAGARNKVVIYYDTADMGISALAILLPFIALVLTSFQPFVSPLFCWLWKWSILSIGFTAGVYYLLLSLRSAIRHNRSVLLGLFVCVFKLAFLILGFLVIYSQIGSRKDRENTLEEKFFALAIILCVVALGRAMINGLAVYQAKGWCLTRNRNNPKILMVK